MFRAHVLIIRRSKLHYTASGIITPIGCVTQFWPPDYEHMCSKHVEAWNKTYRETKFCASSWLNTEINVEFYSKNKVGEISASSWFYYKKDDPLVFKYVATVRSTTVSGVKLSYLFIYLLIDLSISNKNKFQTSALKFELFFSQYYLPVTVSHHTFTLVFEKRQERFSVTNKEKHETTDYGVLVVTLFNSLEKYKCFGRNCCRHLLTWSWEHNMTIPNTTNCTQSWQTRGKQHIFPS